MIGAPPAPAGQLSPDGRWRWDGTRWVPVQSQRTSHRRFWLLATAGCLTLVLLTAAGLGFWGYSLWQGIKNGTVSCLSSNFPRYPGSTLGPWSYDLNESHGTCQAALESNDDVATVASYYQSKLNGGAWQVTLTNDQTNMFTIESASGSAPYGTVQVAAKDPGSETTITLYSGTCLLPGFPAYPRAKFGGETTDPNGYSCHLILLTKDRASAVIAFYKSKLSQGNWQVLSSDSTQVRWQLVEPNKNRYRTVATGSVTVGVSSDERTQITVDSSP